MKNNEAAKQYSAVCRNFLHSEPLFGLLTLPSGDGNYQSRLDAATDEDLSTALSVMNAFPDGNRSRIMACERQLKKLVG